MNDQTSLPAEGLWDAASAQLPAGPYTWHRFRGRGYVALVGTTPVATVAPVHEGGWALRLEGFRWISLPARGSAASPQPADCRWYASIRAAMAAAGTLMAAAPWYRRENVGPVNTGRKRQGAADAVDQGGQAALAF